MRVDFIANLSDLMGVQHLEVDVVREGLHTVRDLVLYLKRVADRRGSGVYEEVFREDGSVKDSVNVLIDGRNAQFLMGFDTPLEGVSVVTLIPPVAGG